MDIFLWKSVCLKGDTFLNKKNLQCISVETYILQVYSLAKSKLLTLIASYAESRKPASRKTYSVIVCSWIFCSNFSKIYEIFHILEWTHCTGLTLYYVQSDPETMIACFNRKRLGFFARSVFMKICMQVPIRTIYEYIYIRSKKPPRAAAARFALARITIITHYKIGSKALVMLSYVLKYSAYVLKYSAAGVAASRVANMASSQGCHSRRFFFTFYM